MSTTDIDDLAAEFNELEHEWAVKKMFERQPSKELMDRAMKIAQSALTAAQDPGDFDELVMMTSTRSGITSWRNASQTTAYFRLDLKIRTQRSWPSRTFQANGAMLCSR